MVPAGPLAGPACPGALAWAAPLGRALGGQHGRHRGHAGKIMHRFLRGLAQRLHGGALARVDLDGETDVAVLDDQAGNHAQADDVLTPGRILHRLEGLQHGGFADRTHSLKTPRSCRYACRR
jgi:hypothetical protein